MEEKIPRKKCKAPFNWKKKLPFTASDENHPDAKIIGDTWEESKVELEEEFIFRNGVNFSKTNLILDLIKMIQNLSGRYMLDTQK